jgi:predicted dehydrogenase
MVRINCIGAGHWGPNLIRNLASHPEVDVGIVSDLSGPRLDMVRQRIRGIGRCTTDADEALLDPGAAAVVIATPVSTHFEMCKKALESGKHVLVEKPLCGSSCEAEQLIDIARTSKRVLCVGHVFLFNAGVRMVKTILDSGTLGRIRYIYATRTNLGPFRHDVNALWDLASHDLSIFDYWLGMPAIAVSAQGAAFLNPEVEDMVMATFHYPDDVMALVHASWLNPRKVREIVIVGERRMLVWNDLDLDAPLRVYDKAVDVDHAEPEFSDSFGSFRMHIRNGDITIPFVAGHEPLAEECKHFVDCIMGRAMPLNNAIRSLAVVQSLEAADKSIANNGLLTEVLPPWSATPATEGATYTTGANLA